MSYDVTNPAFFNEDALRAEVGRLQGELLKWKALSETHSEARKRAEYALEAARNALPFMSEGPAARSLRAALTAAQPQEPSLHRRTGPIIDPLIGAQPEEKK